jgi:hypothetical protein
VSLEEAQRAIIFDDLTNEIKAEARAWVTTEVAGLQNWQFCYRQRLFKVSVPLELTLNYLSMNRKFKTQSFCVFSREKNELVVCNSFKGPYRDIM